jgi:hypothetical protein
LPSAKKNSFAAKKYCTKNQLTKMWRRKLWKIVDTDISPRLWVLALFSTPSTALHQSAALTLRGGSA